MDGSADRVVVDGKFFRLGGRKFSPKGVTYGPFAPDGKGGHFASPERTRADFALIRSLGANLVRVYYVPPRWFLDLADESGLKVFIDVPWPKDGCFLDTAAGQGAARTAIREAAEACRNHAAVFAVSVANEIPADVVRWSGARRVGQFLEELIELGRSVDPGLLFTFGNFPPTEFLRVANADFVCFNVYLHEQRAFENYLARLQMIAEARPLVLGETGMDSLREGEAARCEWFGWAIESVFRAGLAGMVVFSFTDDWWRGGSIITDWAFGLVDRDRQPKDACAVVQREFALAPCFPLPRYPRVSVVVASYNGGRTLATCLKSLQQLNYPDYEVILVDDGSTDDTPAIVRGFPTVRWLRHATNQGLSVARNTGIAAATGEIVAFTDADCRADEHWLYHVVGALLTGEFAGVGGHNLLPPDDSWIAAAVMASPGGPAHVMLTDRVAEHIPGCNMVFWKWALVEVGGFNPVFRCAGDDVDICWRIQQRGHRLGFDSAGFVWHYRRSTVQAYLRQQSGYGEAEALLAHRHPEYFNAIGAGIWRGRIYSAARLGVLLAGDRIYHGIFGGAWFQTLYAATPALGLMLATSIEYHVLITLPLMIVAYSLWPWLWPVAIASLVLSVSVCVAAAWQADIPRSRRHLWSRPLVALLFLLQPVFRGVARYRSGLLSRTLPATANQRNLPAVGDDPVDAAGVVSYWSDASIERMDLAAAIAAGLEREGWRHRTDEGWSDYDVEVSGTRWSRLQLVTVMEHLPGGGRLHRVRLRPGWSMQALAAFWGLVAAELLIIGFGRRQFSWVWYLLLTLPLFAWYLDQEQKRVVRLLVGLLDEIAGSLRMHRVPVDAPPVIAKPQADAADRRD